MKSSQTNGNIKGRMVTHARTMSPICHLILRKPDVFWFEISVNYSVETSCFQVQGHLVLVLHSREREGDVGITSLELQLPWKRHPQYRQGIHEFDPFARERWLDEAAQCCSDEWRMLYQVAHWREDERNVPFVWFARRENMLFLKSWTPTGVQLRIGVNPFWKSKMGNRIIL